MRVERHEESSRAGVIDRWEAKVEVGNEDGMEKGRGIIE